MITAGVLVLLVLAGPEWSSGCTLAPPGGHPWTYRDLDAWESFNNSFCGEEDRQQSPIDLHEDECGEDSIQPRVRKNANTWKVNVTNNGRTLKLMFDCYDQVASNGAHGPLTLFSDVGRKYGSYDYDLAEAHFHWGQKDERGSEHAIEGDKYRAEAHLKFKHSEHRGVAYHVAKVTEGALHALGVLLTDDEDSDGDMKFPTFGLENKIKKVREFNASFRMKIKIKPLKKLLDKALEQVYKYIGSLTTPPCTLELAWLVSAKPATIKSKLLSELRKLKDETGRRIKRNYRPLQEHTDELNLCLHEGNDGNDNGHGNGNGYDNGHGNGNGGHDNGNGNGNGNGDGNGNNGNGHGYGYGHHY